MSALRSLSRTSVHVPMRYSAAVRQPGGVCGRTWLLPAAPLSQSPALPACWPCAVAALHTFPRRSFAAAAAPTPPWPVTPPAAAASPAAAAAAAAATTAASPSEAGTVTAALAQRLPLKHAPPLDTFQLVARLRENGLTESQAVVLMEALCRVSMDAQDASQSALQSTYKADLSAVRVHVDGKFSAIEAMVTEKIFNAQLKADMQTKYWREGLQKDVTHEVTGLKSEMLQQRATAEAERNAMRKEMQSQFDKEKALALAEMEKMENKLSQTGKTGRRGSQAGDGGAAGVGRSRSSCSSLLALLPVALLT